MIRGFDGKCHEIDVGSGGQTMPGSRNVSTTVILQVMLSEKTFDKANKNCKVYVHMFSCNV